MTRSTVNPEPIFIRKIANSNAYLRVRWGVKQIEITDDNGNHTEYEYNEQKLVVPIPDDVVSPDDLKNWIVESSSDLINQAKSVVTRIEESPKADDVREMNITDVRKKIADTTLATK